MLLNTAALFSNYSYCLHSNEQQLFEVVQHVKNPVLQELPDANTLHTSALLLQCMVCLTDLTATLSSFDMTTITVLNENAFLHVVHAKMTLNSNII